MWLFIICCFGLLCMYTITITACTKLLSYMSLATSKIYLYLMYHRVDVLVSSTVHKFNIGKNIRWKYPIRKTGRKVLNQKRTQTGRRAFYLTDKLHQGHDGLSNWSNSNLSLKVRVTGSQATYEAISSANVDSTLVRDYCVSTLNGGVPKQINIRLGSQIQGREGKWGSRRSAQARFVKATRWGWPLL